MCIVCSVSVSVSVSVCFCFSSSSFFFFANPQNFSFVLPRQRRVKAREGRLFISDCGGGGAGGTGGGSGDVRRRRRVGAAAAAAAAAAATAPAAALGLLLVHGSRNERVTLSLVGLAEVRSEGCSGAGAKKNPGRQNLLVLPILFWLSSTLRFLFFFLFLLLASIPRFIWPPHVFRRPPALVGRKKFHALRGDQLLPASRG
ncbi:hypothetical protein GGR56DRAFT_532273 [Xylariaceae sp. FL0804]|nr:hypothetical protein GGR56DRAFT_532273 [Xylariaceae sp. FL0804]